MNLTKLKRNINGWWLLSTLAILAIILPNITIIKNIFLPASENWTFIRRYALNTYLYNTGGLLLGTGLLSLAIGLGLAWLTTAYRFPGSKHLKYLLILPLTIPPYIGAYTYQGIIDYTGPIQTFLRSLGIQVKPGLFTLMNLSGGIFIFSLFLYPYIFLMVRSFLAKQSGVYVESARLLQKNPLQIFWHVIIPISRVPIVGGVSLVLLEVLNDYGVVKYLGIPAFSTAIYKTWFSMGDINAAIKIAGVLMLIVIGLLALEKVIRGRRKYAITAKSGPLKPLALQGKKKVMAMLFSYGVLGLGFVLPLVQLLRWAYMALQGSVNLNLLALFKNTLFVGGVATFIIVIFSLIIGNYSRLSKGLLGRLYGRITVTGYSIPASVIALGVIVMFLRLDRLLAPLYRVEGALLLSTSIIMLIFAYVIRFLAIGFNAVDAGYARLSPSYHEAARSLGKNSLKTFFLVDLPMIKTAVLSAGILVFIDVVKELPLTLILRPFNFETFATRAFEYAGDEMIQEAAIPSLIIIFISVFAIYLYHKLNRKEA